MPEQTIWFLFSRIDGSFQGSGITFYDDDEIGSTLVENPPYREGVERPYWDGEVWTIKPLDNPFPNTGETLEVE